MLAHIVERSARLLNVKTAHRIVDDCVSPKQRELIAEAKARQYFSALRQEMDADDRVTDNLWRQSGAPWKAILRSPR